MSIGNQQETNKRTKTSPSVLKPEKGRQHPAVRQGKLKRTLAMEWPFEDRSRIGRSQWGTSIRCGHKEAQGRSPCHPIQEVSPQPHRPRRRPAPPSLSTVPCLLLPGARSASASASAQTPSGMAGCPGWGPEASRSSGSGSRKARTPQSLSPLTTELLSLLLLGLQGHYVSLLLDAEVLPKGQGRSLVTPPFQPTAPACEEAAPDSFQGPGYSLRVPAVALRVSAAVAHLRGKLPGYGLASCVSLF